jgi:glycosyl transferase family 87
LIAGGLVALFRVGHGVPFPNQAVLGNRCLHWLAPLNQWSVRAHALTPTLRFGYVGWLVLASGVVAVMRSSGRRRNGWEPAALIAIACAPPVFTCLNILFHPQDLLAMGLILLAVSCAQRNAWMWSGFFLGLAFASQQFAVLAVALLIVLVPAKRRLAFSLTALASLAVLVIPLMALSSGRALWVALTGSGGGGALIYSLEWELHLRDTVSGDLLRALPVIAVLGLAYWARRRLSNVVAEPVALLSLLATAMAIRLVFEGGLYGYYFMASAVTILLLDFVRRRFRPAVILWLAVESLAFAPVPWGIDHLTYGVPMWVWQVLLVPATLALALTPLIDYVKAQRSDAPLAVTTS